MHEFYQNECIILTKRSVRYFLGFLCISRSQRRSNQPMIAVLFSFISSERLSYLLFCQEFKDPVIFVVEIPPE